MKIALIAVLLMVAPAFGQATLPATQPDLNTDLISLRRIVAGLQQQIATLKAENESLKKENARLAKLIPPPAPPAGKKVEIGMTKDEISALAKGKLAFGPPVLSEKTESSSVWKWKLSLEDNIVDDTTSAYNGVYELIGTFDKDGKLTHFRRVNYYTN